MSKSSSGFALSSSLSALCSFCASLNESRTRPCWRAAVWFETFTVNSSVSPSRRNRGGFGCTIRSFAVTVLPSRKPERNWRSCAKPMNFHCVNASGIVNCIFTTPLLSASNCGKKNAVSFRLRRAATWERSGLGAELPSSSRQSWKLSFAAFCFSPPTPAAAKVAGAGDITGAAASMAMPSDISGIAPRANRLRVPN